MAGYSVPDLRVLYDRQMLTRLTRPGEEVEIDPYTEDERDRLIEGFWKHRPHYYPFVFFRFWTGTRPSEAIALRHGQLDLAGRQARIRASRVLGQDGRTKTGRSRRVVVLHGNVVRVLRERLPTHPAHDDFVFTTATGAPIDQANFYRREWVPMLRRLGIRPRPFYNTRHTYISYMLAVGARPLWVARQTGTSLKMIEDHYGDARVSDTELDALIAATTDPETRNLPATLADDESNEVPEKKPRRTGAFFKSGRPGSNRRRPAWEAAQAVEARSSERLINAGLSAPCEASQSFPECPVPTLVDPENPEPFRVGFLFLTRH